MQETDLSVIIINYNVRELLLTSLRTLYMFHRASFSMEVIVVDNNSTDGSMEAVRLQFPEVVLIENKLNAGFPAANNQGFRIAKGRYLFMLNPDTEFFDDSADKLYAHMEANPEIAMAAPKLLNTDGSLQPSFWRYPSLANIFLETIYLDKLLVRKNYRDKDPGKPFEAESFSGAAILFRRELLDTIGYLDEQLFWIEEIDYCYRARQAGYRLEYYPYASLIHHVGQSAKKNYNISVCNQIVNKIKFFKKYHNTFSWLLIVILSLFHVLAKALVFSVLAPLKRQYALKAKAYWYTLPKVFNPPLGMS
jgi:GT2 family glycosyltransferase